MLRMFFLTLSSLGCLVTVCLAEEFVTTSDKAVRESVARSLSYLEKEGVTWMEERGCMSCHHVPFLLWAHRAAQGRGLVVDTEKLMEWNEWARNDSLSHRNLFRLQNYDLGKVDAAILPDTVKEKLKPLIEEPFKSEEALIARLKPLLTEDDLKSYQELILKTAERGPYAVDRAGGGLDVLGQLLLGDKAARGGLGEPEFRDGVVALMRQIQLEDGSWTPGNQFATMRRWSLATANQTTTMWAALAIARWDNAGSKHSPTIQKAVAYLRRQPPNPENREWLATRLLLEHELGTTDEAARLRRQLLDARNPGGGWGWEAGVASDPLTTGLALYVLAKVGQNNDSEGVLDARRWLLASQENDGSWLTPSKNITNSTDRERLKARDEIYHYWGTAWAVIGLIETLPKSVP